MVTAAPIECPSDIEAAIAFLRKEGWSVIQTIRWLIEVHGLCLADAKRRVHLSKEWSDMRTSHDALHDQIEATADEIADSSLKSFSFRKV